jgi:hypothetical protein
LKDPSKNQLGLPAISLEDVTASTIEGATKMGSKFIKNLNEKKKLLSEPNKNHLPITSSVGFSASTTEVVVKTGSKQLIKKSKTHFRQTILVNINYQVLPQQLELIQRREEQL